jgi:hypothetical protein
MHTGIKKVVRIIKNKEIPSTPKIKLNVEKDRSLSNEVKFWKNWNFDVELSNSIQSMRDIKKFKSEIFKAIFLINFDFHPGTNNKISDPNTGKTKIKDKSDIINNYFWKIKILYKRF